MVWLKFEDGVSPERIESHLEECRSLLGRVPVVESVECGQNLTDRAEGFTHCVIVSLRGFDDLPAYIDHPEHIAVAKALMADAELRVMDIEV